MERMANILANWGMPEVKKTVKCLKCGTDNLIPEDRITIRCKGCYMLITISSPSRYVFRKYNCWACLDTGLIEFQKQIDNILYTSNCRCTCKAGENWPRKIPTWDKVPGCPHIKFYEQKNKEKVEKRKAELEANKEKWIEI